MRAEDQAKRAKARAEKLRAELAARRSEEMQRASHDPPRAPLASHRRLHHRRTRRGGRPMAPKARMTAPRTLSPSQVNTYLDCPYRWYCSSVLRLPEPVTHALAIGHAVHQTAAALLTRKRAGQPVTPDDVGDICAQACDAQLSLVESPAARRRGRRGPTRRPRRRRRPGPRTHRTLVDRRRAVDRSGRDRDRHHRINRRRRRPRRHRRGRPIRNRDRHQDHVEAPQRHQPEPSPAGDHLCPAAPAMQRVPHRAARRPHQDGHAGIRDAQDRPGRARLRERRSHPSARQPGMDEGLYLPNRGSNLCSRRHCAHWQACEAEYGGHVRS